MNQALLLLLLLTPFAHAGTVYVPTKEYGWEWGAPPWDYDSGPSQLRPWLEAKPAPRLLDAPKILKRIIVRHHELEDPVTMKFAVLGPPRATNGHSPVFYVWIEWVSKSKFIFDLLDRRHERKAGIAKVAIDGPGEKYLELREWQWEKDLLNDRWQKIFPWDAAVITRKILELHLDRPRRQEDRANGGGKNSPY